MFKRGTKRAFEVVSRATRGKKRWNIFRGDRVVVNSGKDKGNVGVVTKVLRKSNAVVVSGINVAKKHAPAKRDENTNEVLENTGGIFSIEMPIHRSNVQLVDPNTGVGVKTTNRYLDDGTKVRVTRGRNASGAMLPKPDGAFEKRKKRTTTIVTMNPKTGEQQVEEEERSRSGAEANAVGRSDTEEDAAKRVTYRAR